MKKLLTIFIVLCMVFVMQPTQCFAGDSSYYDSDFLCGGLYLEPGTYIRSDNEVYYLHFHEDGNLVLRKGYHGQPIWASNTGGQGGYRCQMQFDGNLVIYNTSNKPIWASNTSGNPSAFLLVQNDGNLVLYKDNQCKKAIWHTNTCGK